MLNFIIQSIGKIKWEVLRKLITGKKYNLTVQDWHKIVNEIRDQPYIILTYRKAHLSTWIVRVAELFLNQKWGCYGHVLVSLHHVDAVVGYDDFEFVEAIGKGVVSSHWDNVFDVDGVCVLKPKYFTASQLSSEIPEILNDIGKQYDNKLNPYDDSQMACVEIGRELLRHLPRYEMQMRVFENMIARKKYLTPDMFRDCPDFEIVLEIKK